MPDLRRTHEACLVILGLVISTGFAGRVLADAAKPSKGPMSSDGDFPPPSPPPPLGESEAAPPAAGTPMTDGETPPARPRVAPRIHVPPPQEEEVAPWLRHPGSGVMLDFGGFGGGADLATAQLSDGTTETLTAGGGVFFSIGGLWTPVWIGDAVGFGVGGYAGVKYQSIGGSNGHLSLTRFPLGAGAHSLVRLTQRWFLFLRGGIQKEIGDSLSGDGDVSGSQDITSSLGLLGEGGVYYVSSAGFNHTAVLLTFRYRARLGQRRQLPGQQRRHRPGRSLQSVSPDAT